MNKKFNVKPKQNYVLIKVMLTKIFSRKKLLYYNIENTFNTC